MGIETNQTNAAASPSKTKRHRPAHKKTNYVKIFTASLAIAVFASGLTAYALPMAAESASASSTPTENASVIVVPVSIPYSPTGGEAADESESTPTAESDTPNVQMAENEAVAASQQTWHEGWTESIKHPAVYETLEPYNVYVCSSCGYETVDYALACSHTHEVGEEPVGDFVTIVQGGYDVLVEDEWVETVEHPGYWS